MKTLLLVLGVAWGWAHPAVFILIALAEYGLAAILIYVLIRRVKRGSYGGHGRARPHPGTAR